MNMVLSIISAGIWPALPLTGYLIFRRYKKINSFPIISLISLITVIGIAIWSLPMLITAMIGLYRAECFGLVGWVFTIFSMAILRKQGQMFSMTGLRLSKWDWVFTTGLILAAVIYLSFPGESIIMERDEGLYANHGIYIYRHGSTDVPYPWPANVDSIFSTGLHDEYPGLYQTHPTITVQFSHLFPVWLAQAFSTFGQHGLFRLNAVFGLLSLGIFYGLCRSVIPVSYAVVATLFLAFNPGQLWVSRLTLTEILAQLFIWSGFLMMLHAIKSSNKKMPRWAGFFLAFSALIRIDSFILVPLLFIAHLIQKIF